MTVYARGYRAYGGAFTTSPAALAIAREGVERVWRSRAFRRIAVLYLVWFVIAAFVLYLAIGMGLPMFGVGNAPRTPEQLTVLMLDTVLRIFYTGVAYLTALLAIFVGSGLIADDLAAGALPLYLVRPLRAADYVLGKALVLPIVLLWAVLVPGFLLYLVAGFWQPPGETWPFLTTHLETPLRVVEHYLIAAASYTGLVLLSSSRSPRRAAVAVLSAAMIFGGVLLQGVAMESRIAGGLGDAMRFAGLPLDSTAPFVRALRATRGRSVSAALPSSESVYVLAGSLLALGLFFAWRRARSVEITS